MKLIGIALTALLLSSCGLFQPVQQLAVPTNLSETGREAAKLINEAKVDLIALNNTITNQVSQGLMTKTDARGFAEKIDRAWGTPDCKDFCVKKAEALLVSGQDLAAKAQAQLLSTLLLELQKQAVARSKK